jgi:hypothetical protein
MSKTYLKKETVTITRTEEISVIDGDVEAKALSESRFWLSLWAMAKKILGKWMRTKDDG